MYNMRQLSSFESTTIVSTTIVSSVFLQEIKDYNNDASSPMWIGMVILLFHAISFVLLMFSLISSMVFLITIDLRTRNVSILLPPSLLLSAILTYLVELAFLIIVRYYQLTIDGPLPEDYNMPRFAIFATVQYIFYAILSVFMIWAFGGCCRIRWNNRG